MTEAELNTSINVDNYNTIYVEPFDDEVWLNIHVRNGGVNVTMSKAQARELIEALTRVVEAE